MSHADIDFDAIRRDEALLVQVVESYVVRGGALHRSGPGYRSRGGDEGNAVTLYRTDDGAWKFHHHKLGEDGDALDVLKLYGNARTVADAARMLGALPAVPERIARRLTREVDHPTPPRWTVDHRYAEMLVGQYAQHLETRERWMAYKPLDPATIARAGLGYGVLPRHEVIRDDGTRAMVHTARCAHPRLIYPVRKGGLVVALRGRHAGCSCDPRATKWLSATGSTAWLYGLETVRRGDRVVVCENPIDALLAARVDPTIVVVAPTAGAGTWRPEWTRHLAAVRPDQILVWYDHDLSGNCRPDHCPTCRAALDRWRTAHPGKVRPPPGGPTVAAALAAAGLRRVEVHHWPATTPPGADLGDVLADYLASSSPRERLLDRTLAMA